MSSSQNKKRANTNHDRASLVIYVRVDSGLGVPEYIVHKNQLDAFKWALEHDNDDIGYATRIVKKLSLDFKE